MSTWMYSGCSSPLRKTSSIARQTRGTFVLFLHNLGVLDHVEAFTRDEFAFDGDCLSPQGNHLRVDGLVFTNEQIGLTVIGLDTDRQAHLDARLRAVDVLRASGVM